MAYVLEVFFLRTNIPKNKIRYFFSVLAIIPHRFLDHGICGYETGLF